MLVCNVRHDIWNVVSLPRRNVTRDDWISSHALDFLDRNKLLPTTDPRDWYINSERTLTFRQASLVRQVKLFYSALKMNEYVYLKPYVLHYKLLINILTLQLNMLVAYFTWLHYRLLFSIKHYINFWS